jgi:glycerophosphoryl diester phosphodiesterase
MSFFKFLFIAVSISFINTSRLVRHPSDVFSQHQVFVESHRGVNREIFQNTLPAVERAIQYGVESFETDIWLTKDNVLVIVHGGNNGDLEGYYDHPGLVTDLTWEELSTYRTIEDNLPMPRLIDMMELTKDKIFMNLEIKDPRVDLVFDQMTNLIEQYDFFDQIAISSFHHDYYNKIVEYNQGRGKELGKELIFGFLYNRNKQSQFDYTKKGSTLNIYYTDATKEVCDKAHENGMAIQSWFGMEDEENTAIYKQLIKNGVDIICTNVPLLAKIYRDNYYE